MSRYGVALIVPALWLILSAVAIQAGGIFSWFDPDYYYLLSSLDITLGHTVGLFQHPGTTAEIFGALVMVAHHAIAGSGVDLQTAVLSDPQPFLVAIYQAIALAIAAALLVVGVVGARVLRPAWLAVLFQASPFLSAIVIEEALARFKPEPFLVLECILLIATLVAFMRTPDADRQRRFAVMLGLICGTGIAAKFTFVSVVAIPLVLLRGRRARTWFAASAVLTFMLCLLPIASRQADLWPWINRVVFHVGLYGEGEAGLVKADVYNQNLVAMIRRVPVFFGVMVFGVVCLAATWRQRTLERRVLASVVLAQMAGAALAAKYYLTPPAIRYLLTSLCFVGVTLLLGTIVLRQAMLLRSRPLKWAFAIVLAAAVAWNVNLERRDVIARLANVRALAAQEEKTLSALARALPKDTAGYARIYDYGIRTPLHGLTAASYYSTSYQQPLLQLYPDVYFCMLECDERNWTEKRLFNWDPLATGIPIDTLRRKYGNKLLLIYGRGPTVAYVGDEPATQP